MTLQVEVISRETIKPSIPTPEHLKDFKLSLIDQYIPPIHVPIVLFYPAKIGSDNVDDLKTSVRLKKSLSETLSLFYPLGGRLYGNLFLECNDAGIEYVEAEVGGELKEVISCLKSEELIQLNACDFCTATMDSVPLLAVQVNKFKCGGKAIAVCVSHKAADASSLCTFVNTWARTACGSSEKILFPKFDAATLFPPTKVDSIQLPTGTPKNMVVGRRFIFEASNISALKAKAANSSYVENPTRVEAIVALLWRCALNVSRHRVGFIKPSLVNLGVNVRGKMANPLPDHSFGNFITAAITSLTSKNENDLHILVEKLREAKRKVEKDFKQELHAVSDVVKTCHETMKELHLQNAIGEVEYYTFTSWCRFPFYEADFGWGKPNRANGVNLLFRNVVVLTDTVSGDGVEAWVYLDEQEMARFECEEELLSYASLV